MAFTEKYILVCDDVRIENNGKMIIIGLYQDTMTVPQLPFALPSLSFFAVFDASQIGDFGFRAKLTNLEVGKHIAQAMGSIKIMQPAKAVNVIQFRNVQLDRAGSYQFTLAIDEEPAPFTTSINVILVPPPRQQQ
jgi:hypothetical protein